jgi:hypothetical protein
MLRSFDNKARSHLRLLLLCGISVAACGDSGAGGEGTESESETESGSGSTSTTTAGSVTVTSTSTTTTATSTTGGDPCAGETCGGAGTCMVLPDGGAWCDCDAGYDNDGPLSCVPDGGSASTTSGASAETGADTGADTGDGSTGGGSACTDLVNIPMSAEDAVLTGSWAVTMSMLGEGMVVSMPMGQTDGTIVWQPDIPCDDTWFVWVRYLDYGGGDSYYARLDGEPADPPAVFEGGCDDQGMGYDWNDLNWRDEMELPCMYVEDPWSADWTTGVHDIEFSYRESAAIARIIVTNDPDFVPGPGD